MASIRPFLRRAADPLLGLAVTLLYAVEILAREGARPSLLLAVAAVGGVGLSLRRRSPLVGFLLAAASILGITQIAPGFDNDSLALVVTFFVSLYSLGRHTSGMERWLGAAGVLAFIVTFLLSETGNGSIDSGDVGFATFFVGTPWAAGLVIRLRREREHILSAENRRLELEQEERARAAVAAERARIARELHDVVSHAIAVTVLQARGGKKMIGIDDDEARRALEAIEHTNTQALSDMRRLLSLLRDTEDGAPLGPQPSLGHLESLVEQVRSSGVPVELMVSGHHDAVPPGVDLSAYRIIQEALTNTLKHGGPGAQARVEVVYGDDGLEISVVDDGRSGVNGRGHGLVGIRERVAVVGGDVDAGPVESGGFAVRARLPYAVVT
jgi:signal transduction histidine kinase